jgi:alkylation response protein AidB-like acyl-CoA dehydrogenase
MWRERSQDSLISMHFWRGVLGTGCSGTSNHGRIASPNPTLWRKRYAQPCLGIPAGRRAPGRYGAPMDLTYPPEAEAFRGVISSWLDENLPDGWGKPDFSLSPEERAAFNEQWTAKLFAGGWICASWPVEYGGKGLTLLQQVVLNEEFARVGAPLRADFFGDTLVGPTVLQWGTEEQKQRFIPRILNGTISWCQGFSEPDAGSDLASLKTRAVLDGDEWVINGQKVWTTQARVADYIFLLARTDPDVPKHAGISYLLVPMHQPGIEVRPIEQIDGSAEFNEVFFTDVRCPRDNVVGGVNNGWKVAMTTLGFERGTSATTGHRRFLKEFNEILELARARGASGDPLIRQRLARSWSKIKIMQINGYRTLTDALNGTHHTAALGACNKMFWSEAHQETLLLAMDILGLEGQILRGQEGQEVVLPGARRARADYPVDNLQSLFFFSRSETIWGGAAEIQRNIVGERVLGLPKEPAGS